MRSSNKLTAMALALAIGSTMSVATTFAEGEEAPIAPVASEEVSTTTAADEKSDITETTPENPSGEEVFGNITVKIADDGNQISFYDSAANISIICGNGVMTFDGAVITKGSTVPSDKAERFAEIVNTVNAMNISSITFTDNVTEVSFDGFNMGSGVTQVKFGKNIASISDNAFGGFPGLKSVQGYKGTAAEKFANDKNLEFTALDAAEIPEATTTAAPTTTAAKNTTATAAVKKTTTASKATSTKKNAKTTTAAKTTAASTTKSSTSPKTGDHGVGAAVGLFGAAAAALAVTRKKKHE